MNDKKFLTAVTLISLTLLIGGIFLAGKLTSTASVEIDANAKVVAEETAHEWGEINLNDGNVQKVFKITNSGTAPLVLSNVATSCMCTTAELSLGEEKSPKFGMHTKSSYVLEVPAGETAELKVIFDPAFHGPSGVGPINRQVTVATNDPENPELNFMLTAMVKR